jgi:hypothetical protein
MKPRHAAALVLLGWYLMVPPTNGPNGFDVDVPLSWWRTLGLYASAEQCEQARQDFIRRSVQAGAIGDQPQADQRIAVAEHSQCFNGQPSPTN